ncbi:hypothetical protein PG996_008974 [Apiospora saccharicola]|uniref:Uncharacterized protein n=1 Tax=Apiospora saccharicola TaxID=335842 RepID=A0ABR1UZG6_9PEZI
MKDADAETSTSSAASQSKAREISASSSYGSLQPKKIVTVKLPVDRSPQVSGKPNTASSSASAKPTVDPAKSGTAASGSASGSVPAAGAAPVTPADPAAPADADNDDDAASSSNEYQELGNEEVSVSNVPPGPHSPNASSEPDPDQRACFMDMESLPFGLPAFFGVPGEGKTHPCLFIAVECCAAQINLKQAESHVDSARLDFGFSSPSTTTGSTETWPKAFICGPVNVQVDDICKKLNDIITRLGLPIQVLRLNTMERELGVGRAPRSTFHQLPARKYEEVTVHRHLVERLGRLLAAQCTQQGQGKQQNGAEYDEIPSFELTVMAELEIDKITGTFDAERIHAGKDNASSDVVPTFRFHFLDLTAEKCVKQKTKKGRSLRDANLNLATAKAEAWFTPDTAKLELYNNLPAYNISTFQNTGLYVIMTAVTAMQSAKESPESPEFPDMRRITQSHRQQGLSKKTNLTLLLAFTKHLQDTLFYQVYAEK